MEHKINRSSNINNLKQHNNVSLGANINTSERMKGPWNHIYTNNIRSPSASSYALDDIGYTNLSGFSWPPRLYACSFCKREFKSAQALGGHMNIHRRDRARLRQSPPASPSPPELGTGICPPMTSVADSINPSLIPSPSPTLIYSSTWMIQNPNNKTANYTTHSSTVSSLKPSSSFIVSPSSGALGNGTERWSTSKNTSNLLIDANYKEHHSIPGAILNNERDKGGLLRLGLVTSMQRKKDVDLELRLGYSS